MLREPRFKTTENPTSRRPSESTQEALNSLLAICSSHFEPFSTISAKIRKFTRILFALCCLLFMVLFNTPKHMQSLNRTESTGIGPLSKFGDFCRNRRKWLEMARTHRQKAIQGLLSRFRWSPGGRIFGRFEPGSLSTFFQKSNLEI